MSLLFSLHKYLLVVMTIISATLWQRRHYCFVYTSDLPRAVYVYETNRENILSAIAKTGKVCVFYYFYYYSFVKQVKPYETQALHDDVLNNTWQNSKDD